MSFADFLEVMHLQIRAEDLPKEVIKAFQAADTSRISTIPAVDAHVASLRRTIE